MVCLVQMLILSHRTDCVILVIIVLVWIFWIRKYVFTSICLSICTYFYLSSGLVSSRSCLNLFIYGSVVLVFFTCWSSCCWVLHTVVVIWYGCYVPSRVLIYWSRGSCCVICIWIPLFIVVLVVQILYRVLVRLLIWSMIRVWIVSHRSRSRQIGVVCVCFDHFMWVLRMVWSYVLVVSVVVLVCGWPSIVLYHSSCIFLLVGPFLVFLSIWIVVVLNLCLIIFFVFFTYIPLLGCLFLFTASSPWKNLLI